MKVIFAVDDSKYSTHALETVGARPWPTGTAFRLISVVEVGRHESEDIHLKVVDAIKQSLNEKARIITTLHPGSAVDIRIVQGNVKEAILQEAEDWGATHIVVGAHGRKGFQKFLLGSVAEGISGHASCAVEIVRIKGEKKGSK